MNLLKKMINQNKILIFILMLSSCSYYPCPKKYIGSGEIYLHCKLDYGAKWVLKEK